MTEEIKQKFQTLLVCHNEACIWNFRKRCLRKHVELNGKGECINQEIKRRWISVEVR